VESVAVDATDIIVSDENYGEAAPLMDETYERVRSRLIPLLQAGTTPVVTGFIAATSDGVITTLGRGGSDYSAAIVGSCLDSDEIWIWTDVDGVMTADPRVVKDARTLPELSYSEMAELSYFGARVLHPKTTVPAMAKGIPLRIKNTFNPQHPGTLIVSEPTSTDAGAKSITSIKGVSQITVEGRGMIGVPDIAARVFTTVAQRGISVLMLSQSSSGQNICFVVQDAVAPRVVEALEESFAREFARQDIDRIWMQNSVAIVAVVGAGMKGTPGVAAKVFGAVGRHGVNVISIAQGSSEMNICFVVEEEDADEVVRYVHQEFQLGETN
jgi:aspartate kinase